MSCYTIYIKNKSHSEVLAVIDKVISNKKTPAAAAKELGLPEEEFKELYSDITAKMLVM